MRRLGPYMRYIGMVPRHGHPAAQARDLQLTIQIRKSPVDIKTCGSKKQYKRHYQ